MGILTSSHDGAGCGWVLEMGEGGTSSRPGRGVCGGPTRVLVVGTRTLILTLTLGLARHH